MPREVIEQAVFDEIAAEIAAIEHDQMLLDVSNFVVREQARRELVDGIIGRLDRLIDRADKGPKKKLRAVKRQAAKTRSLLEQANEQLFAAVRAQIQQGDCSQAGLTRLLEGYVERRKREVWNDPPRYDALDTFVDGLIQITEMPRTQREPEPEMVLYQPTPARIVLDLVRRLRITPGDVFYDLGSGLGRVSILAGLVSDAQVRGVEYEPAYVAYARRRTQELNLSRVEFINEDAREVNYADGTIFYLYTPFKGRILQRVLEVLRHEARSRTIKVCTYGPGTLEVLPQEWLHSVDDPHPNIHRGTIYKSR